MKLTHKELRQLVEQAVEQGWIVNLTSGSHLRWKAPDGALFFTASTPSDRRALLNIRRDLLNHGFIEISRQERRKRNGNNS
jgi:predicted RNA binding protein YcfA (HicA-like mRNA interferase family)